MINRTNRIAPVGMGRENENFKVLRKCSRTLEDLRNFQGRLRANFCIRIYVSYFVGFIAHVRSGKNVIILMDNFYIFAFNRGSALENLASENIVSKYQLFNVSL